MMRSNFGAGLVVALITALAAPAAASVMDVRVVGIASGSQGIFSPVGPFVDAPFMFVGLFNSRPALNTRTYGPSGYFFEHNSGSSARPIATGILSLNGVDVPRLGTRYSNINVEDASDRIHRSMFFGVQMDAAYPSSLLWLGIASQRLGDATSSSPDDLPFVGDLCAGAVRCDGTIYEGLSLNPIATLELTSFTFGTTYYSPNPEPSAWALAILGFGLSGAMLRRTRRSLAQPSHPQQ